MIAFTTSLLEDQRRSQREQMVRRDISSSGFDGRTPIEDPRVIQAIRGVPRHRFVPPAVMASAYDDTALPIGCGQTISQPYMVALMTERLCLSQEAVVLEVGTGSGYQTAVLAEIAAHVYTVEIIPELAEIARQRLKNLGYVNITARVGDGYRGWAEHAPYDAIMLTAAPEEIPPAVIAQLKPGGRMILPLGRTSDAQSLMLVVRQPDGEIHQERIIPVRFVPMTRETVSAPVVS